MGKSIKSLPMFNKHYKMERFGVLFVFFVTLIMIIYGVSIKIATDNNKMTLTNQVLYSKDEMVWSLSGKKISVKEVYRNEDYTKAFILFYMVPEEMTSIKANRYKVFITSIGDTKITHDISGTMYVFGGTGYFGLSLYDNQGFEPTIADIVIRDKGFVFDNQEMDSTYEGMDQTYATYNQTFFDMNLHGKDAVVAKFLNNDDASISDIYAQTVATFEQAELYEQLSDDLKEYDKYLKQVARYKDELISYGFGNIPAIPACIAGDIISSDPMSTIDNPLIFEESMLDLTTDVISSDYMNNVNTTTDEEMVVDLDMQNIYMSTKFVFPGGIQFNYQDMELGTNYLDTMLPNNLSYAEWLVKKTSDAEIYNRTWYNTKYTLLMNGSEYISDVNLNPNSTMFDTAIKNYDTAITNAINKKKSYQTEHLPKILALEDITERMPSIADTYSDKEMITVY